MATVSLTNYASQVAEIERQKKLAEMLQQQAQQPIEIQSYKGTQAPIPWSAVLAKVLGQVGGQIKEARAIKQAGALSDLDRKTAAGLPEQMQHTVTMDNVRSLAGPQMQPSTGLGSKLASLLSKGGQAAPVDPTAAPTMPPPAPAMAPPQAPITQSNLPPIAPTPDSSQANLARALGGETIAPPPQIQSASEIAAQMAKGFVPAQRDVTLDRALSPAEQQQMALKAMLSGGPMTESMGKLLYSSATEKQTKAEDRTAKIEDAQKALDMKRVNDARDVADMVRAIRNSGMPPELQDRYINALPVAGLPGVKEMVVADMKPPTRKSVYDEYLDAVGSGWTPPDPTNPNFFAQYIDQSKKGTLGGTMVVNQGASVIQPGGSPSAPAAPGTFGAQIESTVAGLIPGATITSGARTPEKNAAVGGVSDSYHLSDNARDYRPPAGVSTAQMAAALKVKMPGFDVIDEGTHVHVEPGPGMAKPSNGGAKVLYQAPGGSKNNFLKPTLLQRTVNGKTEEILASFDKNAGAYIDMKGNKLDPNGITLAPNGGARASTAIMRTMTSAGDATSGLENLSKLSSTNPNLGWLYNIKNTPLGALTRTLTSQEAQDIRTTYAGLNRAMGGLATGGLSVTDKVSESYDALVMQGGQTRLTTVRQLAEMRQQADNAINSFLVSPFVSSEQKDLLRSYKARMAAAIPWTPSDVSDLTNSKNPNATIRGMGVKMMPNAGGQAIAAPAGGNRTRSDW